MLIATYNETNLQELCSYTDYEEFIEKLDSHEGSEYDEDLVNIKLDDSCPIIDALEELFTKHYQQEGNIDLETFFTISELAEYEIFQALVNLENDYDYDYEDNDIYYCSSLEDLAEQFVDDGLYGPIPDALVSYVDYEKIAHDLSFEYSEQRIAGQDIIFRGN